MKLGTTWNVGPWNVWTERVEPLENTYLSLENTYLSLGEHLPLSGEHLPLSGEHLPLSGRSTPVPLRQTFFFWEGGPLPPAVVLDIGGRSIVMAIWEVRGGASD